MRIIFRLSCFILAISLCLVIFLGWTEPGLRVLSRGISSLSGGSVIFGQTNGALLLSFSIEDTTITTDALDVRIGSVTSTWQFVELFEKRLHVENFRASGIDIQLKEEEEAESKSSDESMSMPSLITPVSILFDDITVTAFRLLDVDSSELTRIDSLSLNFSGKDSLFHLSDVLLSAPGYGGTLQGSIDTGKEWDINVTGDVEYRDYETGPFTGHVSFTGPLSCLDTVIDLHTPARGNIVGQIKELPNDFSWHADLALYDVQLADTYEDMPEMVFTITGSAEGESLTYGGKLQGKIDYLFFNDVSFEGKLYGNEDQIEFSEVIASNSQGKAHLFEGLLSWKDDLLWKGHLEVEDINPAMFSDEYPGLIDGELISSGRYNDDSGLILDADFKRFSGILRGYEIGGHGRLLLDEKKLSLENVLLRSGKAVVKVNGHAESELSLSNWQESLSWKAAVSVSEFDPALFFPDYPGLVNTELLSEGTSTSGNIEGIAEITALHGELRGFPIKGAGALHMTDQLATVKNMFLKSGNSTLNVAGVVGDSLDITVELFSENIGEFVEGAKGNVKLNGSVTGDVKSPEVEVTASAKELSYQEGKVDSLDVKLSGGIDTNSAITASIKGKGVHVDSVSLTEIDLALDGVQKKHNFSANVVSSDGELKLHGNGELKEDNSWVADIKNVKGGHPLLGNWQQDGVASVLVSSMNSSLQSLCLKSGKENICLDGEWLQEENNWDVDLNVTHFSLKRLAGLLGVTEPIEGAISAKLTASGDLEQVVSAQGQAELVDAGLGGLDEDSEWNALRVDAAKVDFDLKHQILTTNLLTDFSDGSTLKMTVEIPDVGQYDVDPATFRLDGNIDVNLSNLGFVTPLTDYFIRPSGTLKGNMNISGTLFQPAATGKISLVDGELEIPGLGITIRDVQFDFSGKNEELDIEVTASSGQGKLNTSGNLKFDSSGIIGDFRITGENFDTAILPEYEIRASPDLHFTFNADGGLLRGKVFIPSAVLAPDQMIGSLSASEDVVYVDNVEEDSSVGWEFSTAIQIELGKDVKLEGYGVKGYLRGDLLVEKEPGLHMVGKGEIFLVDGQFSIYGRSMDIQRGRVMFAGGPIDNPGVDVRARKTVADKTRRNNTIEVGVDVRGTADDLEFTLFSDPVMEESDILAYMVVGRARSDVGQQDESILNSAAIAMGLKGVGGIFDDVSELILMDEMYIEGGTEEDMSLVVGKHLTEKLFIGYGHNFFNQEGEVRLRFDLGSGFSVESRSSGEATGADLLYSFEK